MNFSEKEDMLYEKVIDGTILTTKELHRCGFHYSDIEKLIELDILSYIKRGHYQFLQLNHLCDYGRRLLSLKQNDKAKQCFLKCLELSRTEQEKESMLEYLLYYFHLNMEGNHWENVWVYYEILSTHESFYSTADQILHLLLLDRILEVPKKYKEQIIAFKLEDMKTISSQEQNIEFSRTLISYLLNGQLSIMKSQLDDVAVSKTYLTMLDITKILVSKLCDINELNETDPSLEDTELLVEEGTNQDKSKMIMIFEYLKAYDVESAMQCLHDYMKEVGKEDYTFLVEDLIKLSLLEQDECYEDPILALVQMNQDQFLFDVSDYLKRFFESLKQSRIEASKIYLDIIIKAKKNPAFALDTVLVQLVEEKEQVKPCNPIVEDVLVQKSDLDDTVVCGKESTLPVLETMKKEESQDSYQMQFVREKIEEITAGKQQLILLDPMDEDIRQSIHKLVKTIPGVISFSIGERDKRRVVLRAFYQNRIDVHDIVNKFNYSYHCKNDQECLEYGHRLFALPTLKPYVYGILGTVYLRHSDKKRAVDYLTVATELGKLPIFSNGNTKFDFSDIIGELTGLIPVEDKKPRVKMETKEFADTFLVDYHNIPIQELITLISEEGKTLNQACLDLQLTAEQISMSQLMYARICYEQSQNELGDRLLKLVEKTPHKTKRVKSLMDQIIKDRKFYQYRTMDEKRPYALKIPVSNKMLG